MKVTGILHNAEGIAEGVKVEDVLTGNVYEVKARAVVNATGIFVDSIMAMDVPTHEHMVQPSQGCILFLTVLFCKAIVRL